MQGSNPQHEALARARRAIDANLADLPPALRDQKRLLWADLGLVLAPTGHPDDLLTAPGDPPVLRHSLWLLEDLDVRDPFLEEATCRLMLLSLALAHLHDRIQGPVPALDRSFVALADELARSSAGVLDTIAPGNQALAELHAARWGRFHTALLRGPGSPGSPEQVLAMCADRLAPFVLGPAAAAIAVGREELVERLVAMLDDLHGMLVVRRDLLGSRTDLFRGVVRPVLGWGARKLGIDPASSRPEGVFGAFVLSSAILPLAEVWTSQLETSRKTAAELRLDRFAGHAEDVAALMGEVHELFDARSHPPSSRRGISAGSLGTAADALSTAIDTVGRYLLADPSFRESWEIHRWGLAGAEEVTARFPAGLVLEILARHGHPVGHLIDGFAADARARGFAYYDHPDLPHVDSDTLGLLLRLAPFAGKPPAHRKIISAHLAMLREALGPDGRIPVWLSTGDETVLLGESCGVIAAGVVSGMIDVALTGTEATVRLAGREVLERFIEQGTGMSVNYPPLYALVVVADLLDRLREAGTLPDIVSRAHTRLLTEVEREAAAGGVTPQRAALLVRTTLREGLRDRFEREWIDGLLGSQRSDGRWSGEPIFFVPNRGWTVTWYASDLVTSALCYDALHIYRAST